MKYFTELDYPKFDLLSDLNRLIDEGKLNYDSLDDTRPMVRQICMNTVASKPDDTDFGRGSLYYDWDKSYFDATAGKMIVPARDVPLKEEDFDTLCSVFVGTEFERFYNFMKERHTLGRVRIMKSDPKTCLSWHTDTSTRIHYPLKTQEGCMMVINEEVAHMPLNSWWHVDTREKHTAFNASTEERIHIVAVILD